ncbi:MAG TPA: phosphatidylserine/phosphatidylglycerophosphate/cardiolipin synthase family protein [Streptosporangiaceae bacterium]|nr:phosphatidylserine/phosphatidylglycerophosphate/cardiolipin synthase family protein [Streptosporangiaceae bacterium]
MPTRGPFDVADGGQLVERLTISHHRRRLRHVGWMPASDPMSGGWAVGDPPPRPSNAVAVLIDGAEAFRAMAVAIANARSHVHLTGWHVTPDFALTRDGTPTILRRLLAEAAARVPVRVLVWAGAPLPILRPWPGDVRKVRDQLAGESRVQCVLDARERPMHCHHEKTIVIDDRVAFVGGIDLTNFNGDRWDTQDHPSRGAKGWHDVAARITGAAVQDVAENFAMRWQAIAGETLPPVASTPAAGDVELQVVRTVPDGMYPQLPHGDFRILESYLRALRAAQRVIYLENQFLWSPEVLAVLRAKLANPPTPDCRLVLLLPAKPDTGGDDTRGQLGTLVQADGDGGRLLACTLYAIGGEKDWPVYLHAKVGIVDDAWMTIGSANLNEHSLFNDTEMNLVTHDPRLAQETRLRLWAEHLQRPVSEVAGDPADVIERLWKPIAQEQAEGRKRGERATHRLTMLPGVSRRSGLLLGPLQGLVLDA